MEAGRSWCFTRYFCTTRRGQGVRPEWAVRDIDICVSVARIVDTFAPAHSMSTAKWSRDIDLNLTGAVRVVHACLPGMQGRRFGRVVAISSMAGRVGSTGKVAYAAVKAGLHGLMRTIAIANVVLPGIIDGGRGLNSLF